MKKLILLLTAFFLAVLPLAADEGMWLPSLIGTRINDMRSKGFELSAEDIYSVNQASLKDAIVMFGRGCTGELISGEGLLLTNHHCGYGQIQQHSSMEHDYLTDGFWAMNRTEELPNPGLTVSFLVSMEDVTERATRGVVEGMSGQERAAVIEANRAEIAAQAREDGRYSASVESLYYGNQYFLFVYEVFRDIRLVGAPPSAIGKFGGDTDNWMWPRHTGDFSMFRIYAGKDNLPADYSPENVPYKSKKFFTISTQGVQQGDFTFVYGFPAVTREYVTSDFIDYTLNYSNPDKIALRTMRLDIIKAAQDRDPAVRIMYASKAASIANAWKKWQGESLGLTRLGTLEHKQAEERNFQAWADIGPHLRGVYFPPPPTSIGYRDVLPRLHDAYVELLPYAVARDYYMEAVQAVELVPAALRFAAYAETRYVSDGKDDGNTSGDTDGDAGNDSDRTGGGAYADAERGAITAWFEIFFKDYSTAIDRQVAKKVMARYLEVVPEQFIPDGFVASVDAAGGLDAYLDRMFDNSALASRERFEELISLRGEEFRNAVQQDRAIVFAKMFYDIYSGRIAGPYATINGQITDLYNTYMRGLMYSGVSEEFYPDANFTLRVSYGEVDGYQAADGVYHRYMTTLDGIIEKDNPEIYDYDVPQRLRDLYRTGDYGRWGVNVGTRKNPRYTVPVAFLATNHTTGGNSGSPLLNSRGELVGLNFDRTWLSTMSDLEFDPEICRNISVDIRYILFLIDKVCGAEYLLDEMTLVD